MWLKCVRKIGQKYVFLYKNNYIFISEYAYFLAVFLPQTVRLVLSPVLVQKISEKGFFIQNKIKEKDESLFLSMFKLGRNVISVWLFRIAYYYISKIIYAEEKFENMLENVLYQDYVKKESKGIWKLFNPFATRDPYYGGA